MKQKVIEFWRQGMSSGWIAQELGMTRNAVMGIVHRAQKKGELPKRAAPPKKVAKPKAKKPEAAPLQTKPQKPVLRIVETPVKPVVPPPPPVKTSKPKTIMELGMFDCRWIRDDGLYCGEKTKSPTSSWCSEHHRLVYVPNTKKKVLGGGFRF